MGTHDLPHLHIALPGWPGARLSIRSSRVRIGQSSAMNPSVHKSIAEFPVT